MIREAFLVRAPAERVFEFLADPRYLIGIDPSTRIEVEQLAGTGPGVGARFRMTGAGMRGEWQIEYTTYDPPRRMTATFWRDGGSEGGTTTYVLEAAGEGTRVHMQGEFQISPIAALGVALMWPLYRWSVRRGHRKLSRLIEAWAPPSDIAER